MHCLDCGYNLHHLTEHRCPECGRGFDPKDRKSWGTPDAPTIIRMARWLGRTALLVSALTSAVTLYYIGIGCRKYNFGRKPVLVKRIVELGAAGKPEHIGHDRIPRDVFQGQLVNLRQRVFALNDNTAVPAMVNDIMTIKLVKKAKQQ